MRYLSPKCRTLRVLKNNGALPKTTNASYINAFVGMMKDSIGVLNIKRSERSKGNDIMLEYMKTASNMPTEMVSIINISSYVNVTSIAGTKTTGSLYDMLVSGSRYKVINEEGKFEKITNKGTDEGIYSSLIDSIDAIRDFYKSHHMLSATYRPQDYDALRVAIGNIANASSMTADSPESLCVLVYCRFIHVLYQTFIEEKPFIAQQQDIDLVDALLNDNIIKACIMYLRGERMISIMSDLSKAIKSMSEDIKLENGVPVVGPDKYLDVLEAIANTIILDTSVMVEMEADYDAFHKDLTTYRRVYEINNAYNLGLSMSPTLCFYDPNFDGELGMSVTEMQEFVARFNAKYANAVAALSSFVDTYYSADERHSGPNYFSVVRETSKGTVIYKTYVYTRYIDSNYILSQTNLQDKDSHADYTVTDGCHISKGLTRKAINTNERYLKSYAGASHEVKMDVSDDEIKLFAISFILPKCQKVGDLSLTEGSDTYSVRYDGEVFELHPSATERRSIYFAGYDTKTDSFGVNGYLERHVIDTKTLINLSWLTLFFCVSANERPKLEDIHSVYCGKMSDLVDGVASVKGCDILMRTFKMVEGSVFDARLFLATLGKFPLSLYDRRLRMSVSYDVQDAVNQRFRVSRRQEVVIPVHEDNIVDPESGTPDGEWYQRSIGNNEFIYISKKQLSKPLEGYRAVKVYVDLPADLEIGSFTRIDASSDYLTYVFTPTVAGNRLKTDGRVFNHTLLRKYAGDVTNIMDYLEQDLDGNNVFSIIIKALASINTGILLDVNTATNKMIYNVVSGIIAFLNNNNINLNGPVSDSGITFVDRKWADVKKWCEDIIASGKTDDQSLSKYFTTSTKQHPSFAEMFNDIYDASTGMGVLLSNTMVNIDQVLHDRLLGIVRPGVISIGASAISVNIPTGILYDTTSPIALAKTYLNARLVNQFTAQVVSLN